ncbi:MAG: DNA-binding protein WhiA [Coriobacteriales bacterium]|jgi:DNA-binding protein WhiA|nr:DNA-binding protein WhiA [Coriobacteriales bacterium]
MSFTAEVKDELSRVSPEHLACRKAELSALIRIQGRLSGNYRLEITTEIAPVARTAVRLLHDIYQLKTEITTRRSVLHKTYNYLITVPAQLGLEAALRGLGILSESGLELGVDPNLVQRPCCAASYLRGAFLGGGFISNPQGDFHFELTCGHEALANGLVALLAKSEIPARSARRRSAWIVYSKGAEPILDFLALVGAHRGMLAMENVRVTKAVRNDVNRKLNAEMANQAKSIDAALEQLRAIRLLVERRGIDSLPPALQELALLRLSHPDVSLRELGELAAPPLSKSAVYHRVRRIEAIAREYFLKGEQ